MFSIISAMAAVAQFVINVGTWIVSTIVTQVKAMVMRIGAFIGRMALQHSFTRDSPYLYFWITKHIDWIRANKSYEDAEAERDRLINEMGDHDHNGIPDLYDREVTGPALDFLHIKYPVPLLRQNDYVRYMPTRYVMFPQPVSWGSKGLIRSETVLAQGQHVWVKWNALNPRGPMDAPLYKCNAMDLAYIGHVYNSFRVTQ